MKRYIALLGFAWAISSCTPWNQDFDQFTSYKPLAVTRTQLESDFKLQAPKAIVNAGKIYSYQNYLFINEHFEGIHIIDNSDPKNPIKVSFLKILGNVDLSIRNGILFADNAVDLISIDITETTPKIVNRQRRVFKEPLPPDGRAIPEKYTEKTQGEEEIIIVKWILPQE